MPFKKECNHCGKTFIARRSDRKLCSIRCRGLSSIRENKIIHQDENETIIDISTNKHPNSQAIIDTEDCNRLLGKGRWKITETSPGYFCVVRCRINRNERIGRIIMSAKKGFDVDHISRNTLDNRKSNLRVCLHVDNMKNTIIRKNNKSGFKGVCFDKDRNLWAAEIRYDNKRVHLGRFKRINDAVDAYNEASKKYHGEFGRINI